MLAVPTARAKIINPQFPILAVWAELCSPPRAWWAGDRNQGRIPHGLVVEAFSRPPFSLSMLFSLR